jgi:flavin reductase (DIM6/NTAB) family NADH-FMN oxidoreductase RutF
MNDLNNIIKQGILLTSGTIDDFNTMTIGWGFYGTIWRKDVFVCFVRPSRYTYEFMEKSDLFTISFYLPAYREEISFLGSHSGRDIDKVKKVGFTPISIGGSVSFEEAVKTHVCRKIYVQDLDFNALPDEVKEIYYQNPNDTHRMYIGEILETHENY